jgi:hypothetical protein
VGSGRGGKAVPVSQNQARCCHRTDEAADHSSELNFEIELVNVVYFLHTRLTFRLLVGWPNRAKLMVLEGHSNVHRFRDLRTRTAASAHPPDPMTCVVSPIPFRIPARTMAYAVCRQVAVNSVSRKCLPLKGKALELPRNPVVREYRSKLAVGWLHPFSHCFRLCQSLYHFGRGLRQARRRCLPPRR